MKTTSWPLVGLGALLMFGSVIVAYFTNHEPTLVTALIFEFVGLFIVMGAAA